MCGLTIFGYVHVFSNMFLVSDEFVTRVDCPTDAKVLNIRSEKAEPRRSHPSHIVFIGVCLNTANGKV